MRFRVEVMVVLLSVGLLGCRTEPVCRQIYWTRQLAGARGDELVGGIIKVAELRCYSAIPRLIYYLNHKDPAVRFYAWQGLKSLTGHETGYRPYALRPARLSAIKDYLRWWRSRVRRGGAA